jgi:hypothetical protein
LFSITFRHFLAGAFSIVGKIVGTVCTHSTLALPTVSFSFAVIRAAVSARMRCIRSKAIVTCSGVGWRYFCDVRMSSCPAIN